MPFVVGAEVVTLQSRLKIPFELEPPGPNFTNCKMKLRPSVEARNKHSPQTIGNILGNLRHVDGHSRMK